MGMTREEEIKGRIEKYGACYSSLSLEHQQAGDDLRYLLARNEELQRRVERFEAAVLTIRDDPYIYTIPRVMQVLNEAIDAKEHEVTATIEENATSGGRG